MRRTTANDCRHRGNFRWIIRFGLWLCYLLYFFAFAHFKTAAHSYEYFEDHEELSYDLDTAQSQAKYDARLLSEQMLSAEQEQPLAQRADAAQEETASEAVSADDEDDLQPHGRAASCYTNGRKYTHGQKVPRLDACEVCLCMDGEIFCWWEKCDKNKVIQQQQQQQHQTDYSDPYHETTTTKSEPLQQMRTIQEPSKWSKYLKHNHGNALKTMQHKHKQKQKQKQKQKEQETKKKNKKLKNHFYKSQREIELNDHLQSNRQRTHAQHVNQHQQQQQHSEQQQQQHEQQQLQTKEVHWHEHHKQHHSASKILDFPANLPALLYYDYKTEEHEHHQHQHHQQHIMRQQQQRLKQQKLQQQHEQRQSKMLTPTTPATTTTTTTQTTHDDIDDAIVAAVAVGDAAVANDDNDVDGDDDDKNTGDAEIDSDILPEPPTKRPKVTILTTAGKADTTTTTPTVAVATTLFDTSTVSAVAKPTTTLTTKTMSTRIMSIVNIETSPEGAAVKASENQQNDNINNEDNLDDAFHRWLTSTELIAEGYLNNYSTLGDNLTQEATTTTTTTTTPTTMTETTTATSTMTATTAADAVDAVGVDHVVSVNNNIAKVDNKNEQNNKENVLQNEGTKYAIIRSTETDYSSEANGSVVKIDISLTTVDEQQQQQQQQQIDLRAKRLDKDILKAPVATTGMNVSATLLTNTTTATTTSAISSTTLPDPSRQCSVMGTLYNIGDILPQDTGNCLQCICIEGSTADDTPRVTCSPHNCPPLVLPDLLDATGY